MNNISISELLNETRYQLGPDYNSTLEEHCYEVVIEKTGN